MYGVGGPAPLLHPHYLPFRVAVAALELHRVHAAVILAARAEFHLREQILSAFQEVMALVAELVAEICLQTL